MNNSAVNGRNRTQPRNKQKAAWVGCDTESLLPSSELLANVVSDQEAELKLQRRKIIDMGELLDDARSRYANLYDNLPVAYITFEIHGHIINTNLAGKKLLGLEHASSFGKPFLMWLDSVNQQKFTHHLHQTFTQKGKAINQIDILDGKNQTRTVYLESVTDANSPVCRTAIFDITERAKIESQRDEREHHLNLITNALPIMIAYIDKEQKYQFVNKAYSERYSLEKDQIYGRSMSSIIGDLEYAKNTDHIKRVLDGEFVQFVSYSPVKSGRESITEVSYFPAQDINRVGDGFIVLMQDVTGSWVSEARQNMQLSDSAHAARLSIMGEMVCEIAHELNQPLTAISMYGEVCKRHVHSMHEDDAAIIESLDNIAEQAKRAADLIDKLRSLAVKKELKKSYMDMNYVIEDIMKLVSVEAHWNNVILEIKLQDSLPKTQIDTVLIQQVILNLVRNAIEAMMNNKQTNGHIIISSRQEHGEIVVSVEDNGPGIPAHTAKNIFEAFNSSKPDGMGMGLTICRSIVNAHNGRIWTIPNKSGGIIFNFSVLIDKDNGGNNEERSGNNC